MGIQIVHSHIKVTYEYKMIFWGFCISPLKKLQAYIWIEVHVRTRERKSPLQRAEIQARVAAIIFIFSHLKEN